MGERGMTGGGLLESSLDVYATGDLEPCMFGGFSIGGK